MIDVALQVVDVAFKIAVVAAMAFAITFVIAVLMGERDRMRLRQFEERANAPRLQLSPREELQARRDHRDRIGAA